MVVDANMYWGKWGIRTPGVDNPDEFLAELDRHEIDAALVTSLRALSDSTRRGNEEVLELCELAPGRLFAVVCINPLLDPARTESQVIEYARRGARAIRLYPRFHRYSLGDTALLESTVLAAQGAGLPIYITCGLFASPLYPDMSPEVVRPLADAAPDANIIVSGTNYWGYLELKHFMKACHNVCFELSVFQMFEGTRTLCEEGFADRLLMGSGYCLYYAGIGIGKVQSARIEESQRRQIMGGNAVRIFGLEEEAKSP